ncbi:MAG TPA: NlpC/P60 family protein [Candidatus Dormibacteraeota bacterium]|nr:NlpC/P60 family protein [Candidatus Dormibacteraeota bacterium]
MTGASAIAEAVRTFVDAQPGHGVSMVRLEVTDGNGSPLVRGRVLTERQAKDVRDLARRHGAAAELSVAADPDSGLEDGWVEAAVEVLNLWRDPSRAGEEMGRQTQYLAADGPLRRFGADGDFVLVQGRDLAMGWAAARDVLGAGPDVGRTAWSAVARAAEGAARAPVAGDHTLAAVLQRARAELGVPYVWGGTTHAGYDCSGLLQRVLADTTGVVLPRHTGDQRRVGARVAEDARAGDLLFAAPINQKVGHVLLMTSPTTVLHACRTEHQVIEEELADNAKRYRHQGYRRVVEFDP